MEGLQSWLKEVTAGSRKPGRPVVTVSYAQSLDGCLAVQRGQPFAISGPESRVMTHMLRAAHDAILVGVNTVFADDPQLNVRFFVGTDPRPVVLDSHLRLPLDCSLLQRSENLPWVAAVEPVAAARRAALEAKGARVLELPGDGKGRVSLPHLLAQLDSLGVRSLMVEGGAAVITSFLAQRLADLAIVTVAPVILGGTRAVEENLRINGTFPVLDAPRWCKMGEDLVVYGQFQERAV